MASRFARFAAIFLVVCGLNAAACAGDGFPFRPINPFPWLEQTTNVWVPDFPGGTIYQSQLYRLGFVSAEEAAATSSYFRFRQSSFPLSGCNPNSVAIANSRLYVACSSGWGNPDQILVYDLAFSSSSQTLTGLQYANTITNSGFNQLIALAVDSEGDLWVSSYGNGMLFRVSSAELAKPSRQVDRSVTIALGMPAGITVDPADHSFWVVGQFADSGGYVANYSDAAMNGGSTTPTPNACLAAVYSAADNGVPPLTDCLVETATHIAPGGTSVPLFYNPEGVAVTGNNVWVGNNGGGTPGASIVELTKAGSHAPTDPMMFGQNTSQPFACPGGLFAETPTGPLWVNDEGYNVPNTDCGSTGADQGSQIGQELMFPLSTLTAANAAAPTPWMGGAWNVIRAGSPGFGGIFVQDASFAIQFQ